MKTGRVFIGLFGRRNQGKSALINAIAGQQLAIVSDTPGTTTDPVKKTIEIFGIGPCVLVDTAGLDDNGSDIGRQRVQSSLEALLTVDIAILVTSENQYGDEERRLVQRFKELGIPFVIVHNKSDRAPLQAGVRAQMDASGAPVLECSTTLPQGIDSLVETLVRISSATASQPDSLLGDLVQAGEVVALVMPQDQEAPAGRLILPQVQVIRDLLDHHAIVMPIQPEELPRLLEIVRPSLIVTDSQVFASVSQIVPADIPLTSFSIVLARAKGHFDLFIHNTPRISELKDGDRILMLESCTHTASCDDIGRHKIPNLLQKKTGKQLSFDFVPALEPLPQDLSQYALAIQCGGCMVTQKQLWNRVEIINKQNIPITNYGMTIAYLTGIFNRVTEIFS